jgi:RNA polymerase sigma-70 factor (ECF subfamily)
MNESPETRQSLLHRVRDPRDSVAWEEFVTTYEPLVYRVARRRGLQDADAREVTQEVLMSVAGAIDRWDSAGRKGAFRSWLFRITRNLTVNLLVRQKRQVLGTGDTDMLRFLDELPEPSAGDSAIFDEEYRRQLFRRAAEQVRPAVREKTWQAFWRSCVDGESIQQVAADLQMTVGSVYTARSRVTARLNAEIRKLEAEEDEELDDGDSERL